MLAWAALNIVVVIQLRNNQIVQFTESYNINREKRKRFDGPLQFRNMIVKRPPSSHRCRCSCNRRRRRRRRHRPRCLQYSFSLSLSPRSPATLRCAPLTVLRFTSLESVSYIIISVVLFRLAAALFPPCTCRFATFGSVRFVRFARCQCWPKGVLIWSHTAYTHTHQTMRQYVSR